MKDRDNHDTSDAAAGAQTHAADATTAAPTQAGTQEGGQPGAVAFPYAAAGAAFTSWFNEKLLRLPNTSIMLGTKRVHVVELHEDGRLEVELDTEALEPEQQFVAFEVSHLDQLVRKIAALGL
jgi:hypothetical protein